MSIPSQEYQGEDFETFHWDEASQTGFVRLDLAPSYPKKLGIVGYTREFIFTADSSLICRDRILLSKPGRLSWLFHTRRDIGIRLFSGFRAGIGHSPSLEIKADSPDIRLKAGIFETEIVWSYASASGRQPFDHVRYDSTGPVLSASVDFIMRSDAVAPLA
jgi:hypothetical protein